MNDEGGDIRNKY